jgi:hypothetical protein
MNRIKLISTAFTLCLLITGLSSIASAQWRDRDNRDNRGNNDDDCYENGSYNDNRGLQQTIKNLKNSSKDFDREVNRSNDNYLEDLSDTFKDAANRLEDKFDRKKMNRSYNDAQNLVYAAEQLDRQFQNGNRNRGYNNNFQQQWNYIRRDVKTIADSYNIRYNNRNYGGGRGNGNGNGNGNGRGNNNGDWRNRVPFPLPF